MLCACVSYPEVTPDTPYEGNVSPVEYKHVSGAPVRRSAAADAAQIIASGALYGPNAANAAAGEQRRRKPVSSGLLECRIPAEAPK